MKIVDKFSSQYYSPRSEDINSFVFHSTELDFDQSLNMLLGKTERQVSCHYLIDRDGQIYQLVNPENIAWHAGQSYWRGKDKLNENSIGFELVDTDIKGNRVGFTEAQMQSLISLCHELMQRYNIDQKFIVAHSDIAPNRKSDPGEKFDWKLLAENDIGIYYDSNKITPDTTIKARLGDHNDHVYVAKKLLSSIGYKLNQTDHYDQELEEVLVAFKRRFYQNMSDFLNMELFEIMNNLVLEFSNSGS